MADPMYETPDYRGKRPPDAEIAALAARQHGVVARRQVERIGLTRRAIEHRLATGRLHAVHRGVYAVGHRSLSRHGRWMAAVLVADDAALSHRSAAALWGIRAANRIEITVPPPARARPRIEVHRAVLPPDEVTIHDGIPVTTPARTLLDLAPLLSAHHLERAATEAEFRRLTSPTSLGALVARYPNRPGTPAIRKLLEQQRIGSARTRSDVETRFLALLDAAALPRPVVNGTVALDPPHNPEVDFHWPRARLVVEIDTFGTHGTRHAFEQDRIRDRALQLAGYKVFRITDRQLELDPSGIARQLGTSLTQGAP